MDVAEIDVSEDVDPGDVLITFTLVLSTVGDQVLDYLGDCV